MRKQRQEIKMTEIFVAQIWHFSFKQIFKLHLKMLCSGKDTIEMNKILVILKWPLFQFSNFTSPNNKGLAANKNQFYMKSIGLTGLSFKIGEKDRTISYTMLSIDGTRSPRLNLKVKHIHNFKCQRSK